MLSYARGLTTPPPVPPGMAGAAAMPGSLSAVSAAARPPAIRLAGRMMASSRLTAIAGRLCVYGC